MDPSRAVLLAPEDFSALVKAAVRDVLSEHANAGELEYLTAAQLARLLDVHPKTIAKLVERDGMPALPLGPREKRFQKAAVVRWLEERATKPGAHTEKHARTLQRIRGG